MSGPVVPAELNECIQPPSLIQTHGLESFLPQKPAQNQCLMLHRHQLSATRTWHPGHRRPVGLQGIMDEMVTLSLRPSQGLHNELLPAPTWAEVRQQSYSQTTDFQGIYRFSTFQSTHIMPLPRQGSFRP